MATAEKRVVTDATGQAMLAELRKIPGVMNPVPIEKGGTGVTTPQEILEVIGAQPKLNIDVEEQLNAAVKSVNEIKPDAHGNVQILRVPMADNFTSDESQVVSGSFIERTTGGDASINDGIATLGVLYGNSIRSGYTAESKNMEIQLASRVDDSIPLSATIDWDIYKSAVNYISTNKTFTYTASWNENPETYGLTLSGTAISGDVINVYYIAENRGTITNATPTSFVQTNWNLFDVTKGYARVLKYSDEHGFKIGGNYTSVSFSATVEGDKTVITPDSDGFFDVPSDGYVFVTGGNDTDTYVLMTWSDWHNGYVGDYLTYAEDAVDFSELMSNAFPFGMCSIGITMDEINFNDKTAVVRIERVAYTIENRILAEQAGRDFVYDDDWIYSVKETPDRIRFNIDNQLVVYDHGVEFFTGTEVPVLAYELFGQNLKDKLRREVVAVTAQNFSASQKAQARQNIEAAWNSEVIKSINNKVPDANGNINIVEGQSSASYGSYRIDPVIPPAAWTLVNGQYQVAYFDPIIKSTMTGAETWLDDNDAMLGNTHFTTIDGALSIITDVLPTTTWRLHVLLAENGATVLEEVHNKADESAIAIVETGTTAFHRITPGQYVMWDGEMYKATADIAIGDTLVSTGNQANLSAITGGIGNDIISKLNVTIYTTVGDFGLNSPVSLADICAAMTYPSIGMFMALQVDPADLPTSSTGGYIRIEKSSNARIRVFYYHKTNTDYNYEMAINNNNELTGTWVLNSVSAVRSLFTTSEAKQIKRIGTYFTEKTAFRALRYGNAITIESYVQITTQVPNGTQFADTQFANAVGQLLFIQEDGTQGTVCTCASGKIQPNTVLKTGYYRVIGSLITPV